MTTKKYDLENFRFCKEDIRDYDAISSVFGTESVDTCIHLAAKTSVPDSITRPRETLEVNVIGTLNMLQICRDNNVRNFVFASSAAVYGHANALPASEEQSPQPISPYGASKLGGEALVSSFKSAIKNSKILRFFNVYGRGQTSTYAGVIKKFTQRLSNHLPPIIYGTGNQTRDFIHVSDVVSAITLAVEARGNTDECENDSFVFNIGTGKPITITELAHLMIRAFGLEGEIEPLYSEAILGDIENSYADIRKAEKILKFSAKDILRSGTLDWQEL
jgi:UDP-glucose 4-epimerase